MIFREFVKEAASLFGYRWKKFRRDSVRRRVAKRMAQAGASSYSAYIKMLREDPKERARFASVFTVTISRFWRDREIIEGLATLLRERLDPERPPRIWCCGAASGEEPLTVAVLFDKMLAHLPPPEILATEIDEACLKRARDALYPEGSAREFPRDLLDEYFVREPEGIRPVEKVRRPIEFVRHDLLRDPPPGGFDVVLCRNLAYTYFIEARQIEITRVFHEALNAGGLLVVGEKDFLPRGTEGLFREVKRAIYERLEE